MFAITFRFSLSADLSSSTQKYDNGTGFNSKLNQDHILRRAIVKLTTQVYGVLLASETVSLSLSIMHVRS